MSKLQARIERLKTNIAHIKNMPVFAWAAKVTAAEEALQNAFFIIEELAAKVEALEATKGGEHGE